MPPTCLWECRELPNQAKKQDVNGQTIRNTNSLRSHSERNHTVSMRNGLGNPGHRDTEAKS